MDRIGKFAGHELQWLQPHALSQSYELRSGDDQIATLSFRGILGSLATGVSADGRWTFKRSGFLVTHVTVREEGSDTDLAVFRHKTWQSGGTIEFPDGRHYLASTNFWQTRYALTTDADSPLVTFRKASGVFHLNAHVDIHAAAVSLPELPWLVMLGWYLKVLLYRDSTVAASS
jgi:hypothetical protein